MAMATAATTPAPAAAVPNKWFILLTCALAVFTGNFISFPLSVIMPTVARTFDVQLPTAQWAVTGHFVALAATMLPIGSQAGSQAVLDARYLARALAGEADVESALRRYESERLPAMNAVTLRIRGMGQEQVMEIAEARAPEGFARIEAVIPREEMERYAREFREAEIGRAHV